MMQTNSRIPATKPQPVVVLGAIIAAATTVVSGLVVLFKDNPTAMLWLGIAGVVVAGVGVFKDQIVKGQVVPYDDVVAYANDERQVITGPAMPGQNGELVQQVTTVDENHPGR
jgi:hypothetical protein